MVVSTEEQRSFTNIGPGTPATVWRRHPSWTAAEPLTVEGYARVVVLAAHPDDESLGAGGLTNTAVASGLDVVIVCATDGEHSHPDSPTLTPAELARIRSREGRAAATALGVDVVHRVELSDGDVEGHEALLTSRLVELVGDGRETLIVAPWRSDGHPDHEAAGRAAATAARRTGADLWEYPVWFWHWADPEQAPWQSLRPFHVEAPALEAKAVAVRAHASQVAPLSALEGDETLLGRELLAHFADSPEHFLRTPSAECPDDSLDRLHRSEPDPWGVETRWYEQRKRDLVLAMLPRARFESALELGCSTGALAEALATRCERVLAADRSAAALAAARARFADQERVRVAELDVPWDWPDGRFDLVVVSEVGYFLSPAALDALVGKIGASLAQGGVLVLCHWRHPVEGWVLDGPDVHRRFEDASLLPVAATYRDRDVEIQVHARLDGWPDPLQ